MWPSVISNIPDPQASDRLNSPSHSGIERSQNANIEAIQNFVGIDGASSVVGTLIYDVRSPASNGGGHVQTANKGGTGQTSYTKGDMLVGQSTSVLTKLAIGTDGAILTADSSQAVGMKWKSGANTVTSFISGGTWNRPTGMSFAEVYLWGGGASGATHNNTFGGGGGGGGAFNYGIFSASTLGASQLVMIGSGGASVAAGTNAGNAGGVTVFGASSLLSAFGGGGGGQGNAGTSSGGGGGGGGQFSVGQNAISSTAGIGGRPGVQIGTNNKVGAGDRSTDNSAGGGGGGDNTNQDAGFSYFGGGGGGSGGSSQGDHAGWSNFGGAGGGGGGTSLSSPGGKSKIGGNGGAGGINANGTPGTVPGGGGGGAISGTSGSGAGGKVIIYEYY